MSKRKIYEIAKELNMPNKDLIEKIKEINIEVKSHLSTVDEKQENEILKYVKKDIQKDSKKMNDKKEKVKISKEEPVIIRREVVVKQDEEKVSKKAVDSSKNTTKVKNNNKDYNIVYREKSDKPLTVSELFGLGNAKKESNEKSKKEIDSKKAINKDVNNTTSNERKNDKKDFDKKKSEVKKDNKVLSHNKVLEIANRVKEEKIKKELEVKEKAQKDRENKGNRNSQNRNRDFKNREVRDNKGKPRTDRNSRDNGQRDSKDFRNRDFKGKEDRDFGKKSFRDNNQDRSRYNDKKQSTTDVITDDLFKENARSNDKKISRQKDKEKEFNKLSETKANKNPRNRVREEEFDVDDLNMLKHQGNLSGMIESGDIFDVYQGRRKQKQPKKKKEKVVKEQAKLTNILIGETITVKDLAQALKVTASDLLMKLMSQGVITTLNSSIDFETAYILSSEYGVTATKKNIVSFEEKLFDDSVDKEEELEERPPVVVVMGHVDHGKTSLLDAIRNTNKVSGEAGGITQHIGAYQVEANGKLITFLDTPGHEAFISMRARGAKATDIAILVVAANDGVMPQTVEAINHAKAAEIPIIVAVNKMDLPGANIDKVKQELIEHEILSEEWGGDTIFVPISAKTGMGIDTLLEMVQLQAEILELKANKNKQAKGTVLEARLDKAKGPVVSMLVNRGTLNTGDTVIVGTSIGRIRSMIDYQGKTIKKAYPSTPVEVTGITTVPEAGSTFYEVDDEKTAKKLIEKREREEKEKKLTSNGAVTLENLFENISKGQAKVLNIVVKADVAGTAEAVKKSLERLSTDEVQVKVINSNVGAISETDVNLARVANAIIIGFNVRPDAVAKEEADKAEIEIKLYSVIYNAIEDVKNAMIGMLDPEYREVVIGTVEVRATFKISKIGTIAGSYITTGLVKRNSKVRVIRDNLVIADSTISSLKREKDDAKEVKSGYECGIQIEGFNDIEVGDTFEVYEIEEIKRKSLKQ